MKRTLQNTIYHAEGDVWTHSKMVCECLVRDKAFHEPADRQRQEQFLYALFHDVGKIFTTSSSLMSLFTDYKAYVKIVFLEVDSGLIVHVRSPAQMLHIWGLPLDPAAFEKAGETFVFY